MDAASLTGSSDAESRRGSWQLVHDDEPGTELDNLGTAELGPGYEARTSGRGAPVHVSLSDVDVATEPEEEVEGQPGFLGRKEQHEQDEAVARRAATPAATPTASLSSSVAALRCGPPVMGRRAGAGLRTEVPRRRRQRLELSLVRRRQSHEAKMARLQQSHEWKIAVFKCSVAAVVTFLAVQQVYKCARGLRTWLTKQLELAAGRFTKQLETLAAEHHRWLGAELQAARRTAAKDLELAMARQSLVSKACTEEAMQKAATQVVLCVKSAVEASENSPFRRQFWHFVARAIFPTWSHTRFLGSLTPTVLDVSQL